MTRGFHFAKIFCKKYEATYLDSDNILWVRIENEFIGKPSLQTKDLRTVWVEDAVLTPEIIDTRFYNIDGSRKSKEEIYKNLSITNSNFIKNLIL